MSSNNRDRRQKTTMDDTKRRTLTIAEAGAQLGLGRSAAYAAAHRGEIPTIRLGRKILVPRDQLDRLLAGELQQDAKTAS
jgi:excisionase family DNA binding protein